jgi:hypothetical protein
MVWLIFFGIYTLIMVLLSRKIDKVSCLNYSMARPSYCSLGGLIIYLGVPWCVVIWMGTCWVFTNPDYLSNYKLHIGDQLIIFLILLIGASVGLSYMVAYRYGEANGRAKGRHEQRVVDGKESL